MIDPNSPVVAAAREAFDREIDKRRIGGAPEDTEWALSEFGHLAMAAALEAALAEHFRQQGGTVSAIGVVAGFLGGLGK